MALLDLFRTMEYLKIEYERHIRKILEDEKEQVKEEEKEC